MGQQVYFHRVRSITDAMLVRGVTMAINGGDDLACRVFRYDGSQAFLDGYLLVDDQEILHALRQSADAKVREIFSRLADRRLFKQVCELPLETVGDAFARSSLSKLDAETAAARALEERIAEKLCVDPDFVIVTKWSVKNPTYRPASYRIEPGEIMILDKNNTVRKIDEFPDLIFRFNKDAASLESIHVYTPRDEWNQPGGGTHEERGQCEQTVKEILISHTS